MKENMKTKISTKQKPANNDKANVSFSSFFGGKKYKKIHKSWTNKSADEFRLLTLQALEIAMSNEEIFQHNGTLYLSQRDLIKLVEGLMHESCDSKKRIEPLSEVLFGLC